MSAKHSIKKSHFQLSIVFRISQASIVYKSSRVLYCVFDCIRFCMYYMVQTVLDQGYSIVPTHYLCDLFLLYVLLQYCFICSSLRKKEKGGQCGASCPITLSFLSFIHIIVTYTFHSLYYMYIHFHLLYSMSPVNPTSEQFPLYRRYRETKLCVTVTLQSDHLVIKLSLPTKLNPKSSTLRAIRDNTGNNRGEGNEQKNDKRQKQSSK